MQNFNATATKSPIADKAFRSPIPSDRNKKTKRESNRLRTKGIVVVASFEIPVVTNILDIAPGGVSFLYANDLDIINSKIRMDILIFDGRTNFEYFITQVKGRVTSISSVNLPKSNEQVWRYGVEFLDLDISKKSILLTLFNL